MSRSHTNPPGTQDQPDDVNRRQPGNTLETLRASTDEMEALRLTNQRLLRELEELTRQLRSPQEARQAPEGCDTLPQEERRHPDAPRDAKGEEETSRAREHNPYISLEEDQNRRRPDRNNRGNEPTLYQQGAEGRSWEQRFRNIQQELSHMKEVVKSRTSVSMDILV